MPIQRRFVPAPDDTADIADSRGLWFAFRKGDLLVLDAASAARVPTLAEAFANPMRQQFLGALDGVPCWSAELPDDAEPPPGAEFVGLRALHAHLEETVWTVAGRAAQILAWDRDHQFCGRCATPTERVPGERARKCPACGLLAYPRVTPAIIVLIEREDRILLARGHHFAPGRFGIVAGFVEPGETFEEAVHREVAEEVGVELASVAYWASQPWPFPHGIMVGFQARWGGGEIAIDETEIAEAGWYGIDDLPNIPPKLSIARRLIDDWALRTHGVELGEDRSW